MFHPGRSFTRTELYTSAIRHPAPTTPRGRALTSFHNFFLHLYPVKVPRQIVGLRTTLRLGFIAATLYLILFVSGMYLMFFYHPATPDAYFDMHSLSTAVAFGRFVRNVHRWSAHLMVLVVFLHLLRVFYAGAYRRPRQFNWVIGVVLLLLTLLLSFTGYLLPWDQLSYWAITVGTNIAGYVPVLGAQVRTLMLGGNEVSAATLLRFYVLHIYFLPALMTLVLAIHIWRVRKDDFAVVDRRAEESEGSRDGTKEVADVEAGP
jgi:quinol-cytochrome oxidoreductase complex cytochrome b subunit